MNRQKFQDGIRELLDHEVASLEIDPKLLNDLHSEIPGKWEKHGNLILFPSSSFQNPVWTKFQDKLFPFICSGMKVEKIARKVGVITPKDLFRRPQVEILFGDDGWVSRTENGIKFTWDIAKCMFSSGNISEKQRISTWNLSDQIVVDLFAGIGYFTLSYLVHARAKFLYACEWNPDAVEALKRNLILNKVQESCWLILEGDNKQLCPKNVADHVNLGLIPSSEGSWRVACAALKVTTGGVLHVHGNVDLKEKHSRSDLGNDHLNNLAETSLMCHRMLNGSEGSKQIPEAWFRWCGFVQREIQSIFKDLYPNKSWEFSCLDVVKIKSYGPCVDHLVVDILCKP